MAYYIGLMSGTSVDGIDAALLNITPKKCHYLGQHYHAYPKHIREAILSLCEQGEIHDLCELDYILGQLFAKTALDLLKKVGRSTAEIKAIGSHGQTIRHRPSHDKPFTLQIADPNLIATLTNITTVADFRRKDVALGGQGAPLVPAFHHFLWYQAEKPRIILNIGGMANITVLHDGNVIGYDTGPGNVLLDFWANLHLQRRYDKHGEFAAQGMIDKRLLNNLLADSYFHQSPPKSTGREHFNSTWLQKHLLGDERPQDIQATLAELTATSIATAINNHLTQGEVLICGGGAFNCHLMQRLKRHLSCFELMTTKQYGIPEDMVEASAFAYLAMCTLNKQSGNIPTVTNASRPAPLGGIYHP